MNLKITICTLFIGLIFTIGNGQELTELDKKNGFKDIYLAYPVDSIKGTKLKKEFKEKYDVMSQLYDVDNPEYSSVGSVAVKKIELKVYEGLIYEIRVVTEKDPTLMKGLEQLYGPAFYNVRSATYTWTGVNVGLTFIANSKKTLELVYKSSIVDKMMREVKNEKIKDVADDF
jgi:hypothetical protein